MLSKRKGRRMKYETERTIVWLSIVAYSITCWIIIALWVKSMVKRPQGIFIEGKTVFCSESMSNREIYQRGWTQSR